MTFDYDTVLFDVDGTLIDSNGAHASAWTQALQHHGFCVRIEDVRRRIGMVMIGDTPYDIEAAARAGIPCMALRSGGCWSDSELLAALALFDDPADLLEAILERGQAR